MHSKVHPELVQVQVTRLRARLVWILRPRQLGAIEVLCKPALVVESGDFVRAANRCKVDDNVGDCAAAGKEAEKSLELAHVVCSKSATSYAQSTHRGDPAL